MNLRKQRLTSVLLSILLGFMFFVLASVIMAGELGTTTTCDVPTVSHPTIQSGVDDVSCDIVNLTDALYVENITIDRNVTVQGQGVDNSIVDGSDISSVFTIQPGLSVTLTGMTIRNGTSYVTPYSKGGGVLILTSTVLIDNVKFFDNYADLGGGLSSVDSDVLIQNSEFFSNVAGILGGGFHTGFGTATILNSLIHANKAGSFGGGLYSSKIVIVRTSITGNSADYGAGLYGFDLKVSQSTVNNNMAAQSGGGLSTMFGRIEIYNSTFSYNTAVEDGGGAAINYGTLNMNNGTFIGNSTGDFGGGLINNSGGITVSNSIIANSSSGGDCSGSITSLGYNIDSDDSCSLTATGDQPNVDPLVEPLLDNGGPTWTHALIFGSPALDTANPVAPGGVGMCESIDQRGIARPQDGDGDGDARCDIGAYEELSLNTMNFIYLPAVFNGS